MLKLRKLALPAAVLFALGTTAAIASDNSADRGGVERNSPDKPEKPEKPHKDRPDRPERNHR